MRLIDADKLFPYGSVPYVENDGFKTADKLYGIVKNAPSVDAVPVVRCKDCTNTMLLNLFSISDNSVEEKVLHCGNRLSRVQPDDFCSWGERRDSE